MICLVLSFLTDFICAAFPIVLLRKLHIRRSSKIALCALMGLGIITGAIAIARVATAFEIKDPDLSWVGIPNAMTRIFEVNIGNIAACVPILKPFVRYMHALITGEDPHEILHRKQSTNSRQERWWYGRGRSFFSRKTKSQGSHGQQLSNLPPGVMKMTALGVKGETENVQSDSQRSGSLGLPFQGVDDGQSTPDVPGIPSKYGRGSNAGLGTEFGELRDVKHIV